MVMDDDGTLVTAQLLASVSTRAMESIGTLLRSVLPPHLTEPTANEVLEAVSTLLNYVLTSVLPCLVTNSKKKRKGASAEPWQSVATAKDDFLRSFATSICIPLVQAFSPLSMLFASGVFSIDGNKLRRVPGSNVDIRQEVLCLLRRLISVVDEFNFWADSDCLREQIALEALQEVGRLYSDRSEDSLLGCMSQVPGASWNGGSQLANRVTDLARKEAFWYLCNLLLWLFTPTRRMVSSRPTGMGGNIDRGAVSFMNDGLIREGILLAFSKLIPRTEMETRRGLSCSGGERRGGPSGHQGREWIDPKEAAKNFGELERGTLVAVLEKAWTFWFGAETEEKAGTS